MELQINLILTKLIIYVENESYSRYITHSEQIPERVLDNIVILQRYYCEVLGSNYIGAKANRR